MFGKCLFSLLFSCLLFVQQGCALDQDTIRPDIAQARDAAKRHLELAKEKQALAMGVVKTASFATVDKRILEMMTKFMSEKHNSGELLAIYSAIPQVIWAELNAPAAVLQREFFEKLGPCQVTGDYASYIDLCQKMFDKEIALVQETFQKHGLLDAANTDAHAHLAKLFDANKSYEIAGATSAEKAKEAAKLYIALTQESCAVVMDAVNAVSREACIDRKQAGIQIQDAMDKFMSEKQGSGEILGIYAALPYDVVAELRTAAMFLFQESLEAVCQFNGDKNFFITFAQDLCDKAVIAVQEILQKHGLLEKEEQASCRLESRP